MCRIFILHFFLLLATTGNAQSIDKISNRMYKYDGQVFTYQRMESIFAQDSIAAYHYAQSVQSFKSSKTLGWMSIASVGLGVAAAFRPNTTRQSVVEYLTPSIVLVLFAAPTFGTIGLITRASGRASKRKAIDVFNGRDMGLILPTQYPYAFGVGLTDNGLGVALQF